MTHDPHVPLRWQIVDARRALHVLESFRCTDDRPVSTRGRTLPHPRPWEWEVQRHLRQLSHRLRPGEIVLLGRDETALIAAAHVVVTADDDALEAFVACVAVSVTARGCGGPVADQTMGAIWSLACERASDQGVRDVFLTGKIDVRNRAAQHMAERFGQEPQGVPVDRYQLWVRHERLE